MRSIVTHCRSLRTCANNKNKLCLYSIFQKQSFHTSLYSSCNKTSNEEEDDFHQDDSVYRPRERHPEIKRAWTREDGDHPSFKGKFFPKRFDESEYPDLDEIDVSELIKKVYKEGTRNPMDEPDPDDPPLIFPEEMTFPSPPPKEETES